jgi:hypothetical protein
LFLTISPLEISTRHFLVNTQRKKRKAGGRKKKGEWMDGRKEGKKENKKDTCEQ